MSEMILRAATFPEYQRVVTQNTIGGGHRYLVDGIPCQTCSFCVGQRDGTKSRAKSCQGMQGASTITGAYKGPPYGAGQDSIYKHLFGGPDSKTHNGEGILAQFIKDGFATASLDEIQQAAKAYPNHAEQAREIGTGIDKAVELLLKGHKEGLTSLAGEAAGNEWEKLFGSDSGVSKTDLQNMSETVATTAGHIAEWVIKNEWEVVDVEPTLYHPTLLYAGTADCIARRGDELAVLDWKTGKTYNNHAAQLGGYALAYEAITGVPINSGYLVHAINDEFVVYRVSEFQTAKELFVALLRTKNQWDLVTLQPQ